jgi:hypothetical protein
MNYDSSRFVTDWPTFTLCLLSIQVCQKKEGGNMYFMNRKLTTMFLLFNIETFDVWAETQVKSASARLKPITLQGYKDSVALKDTSLFGFEWSFEWENQKYKW